MQKIGRMRLCIFGMVLFMLVLSTSTHALDIRQLDHRRSPVLDVIVIPSEGETPAEIEYQELLATGDPSPDIQTATSQATPGRDFLLQKREYQANAPFMRVVLTWSAPTRQVNRFSNRLMRRDEGPSDIDAIEAWSKTAPGAVAYSVFDPGSRTMVSSKSVDEMWSAAWRLAEEWSADNPRRWITGRYDTGFRPLQRVMQDLRVTLADQPDMPAVQTLVVVLGRFSHNENQSVRLDAELSRTLHGILVFDVGRGSDYRSSAIRALAPWGDSAALIGRETLEAREAGQRRPSYKMNDLAHDALVRLAGPRYLATVETRRVDHSTSIPFKIGWVGSTDDTRVVTLRRIVPEERIRERVEVLSNEIRLQLERKDFDAALSNLAEIVELDSERGEQLRDTIKKAWRDSILALAAEGDLQNAQASLQSYRESRLPTEAEWVAVDIDMIKKFAAGCLLRFEDAAESEVEAEMERSRTRVAPVPREVNRLVSAFPELVNEERLHRALAAWVKVAAQQAQDIYNLSVLVEAPNMVGSTMQADGIPSDWQRTWRISAGHGASEVIEESRAGIVEQSLSAQPGWYLPVYRALLGSRALASVRAYAIQNDISAEDYLKAVGQAFETVDRGQRRIYANATSALFDAPMKVWHLDGDRPDGLPDIEWRFIERALENAPEGVLLTPWRRPGGGGQVREMCWIWQAWGPRTLVAIGVWGEATAPERNAYRRAINAGHNPSDALREVEILSGEVLLHAGSALMVEVAQLPGMRGEDTRRIKGLWQATRNMLELAGDNALAAHLHVAGTTPQGTRKVADSYAFPTGERLFATVEERIALAVTPYTRKMTQAGRTVLEIGLPFRLQTGRFPAAFLRVILPATDDPEDVGRSVIR